MLLQMRYFWILAFCFFVFIGIGESAAKPIGDDPPCESCCDPSCTPDTTSVSGDCSGSSGCGGQGQCPLGLATGNICETYPVTDTAPANSAGVRVSLHYASFNADGEKASLNTVMGFGWSHSYNIYLFQQGRDIFKQSATGRTTQYKRTGRSGPLTAIRGHQQTVVENSDGSIEVINKDQLTFRFEKISGNPLRVAGREPWMLTHINDSNGNQTTLSYANGLLDIVTDTYGRQASFEYDSQNRLIRITDPIGRVTELGYDDRYNLITVKDPHPSTPDIIYEYNSQHQIISKTDRNGRIWQYIYDDGHPVAIRDPEGDLLFSMINSSGWETSIYDLYRKKQRTYVPSTTTLTDGRGNQWQYDYDENGFVTRAVAPDDSVTRYEYDPLTLNLSSKEDDNGNITSYEYDAKGNMIKETDALDNVTRYEYEPVFNQLTKVTVYQGSTIIHSITEYEYDADGNRMKETRDVGGLSLVREWTYDTNGNVLTETDPNDHVTINEYDIYGNLIRITDPEGNTTEYRYDKTGVPGYEALGNRTQIIDANGHVTRYEYDELDRLTLQIDPLGYATTYEYDGVGNNIEVQRQVTQAPDPVTWQVTRFEYDTRDRLVHEIRNPENLNLVTENIYDENNNRTSTIDPKGNATVFVYDVQNRLSLVIDALGNSNESRYDGVGNRLCSIDANNHYTNYRYDPLNRLIEEAQKIDTQECTPGDTDDIVTQYFYDSGANMSCLRGGGTPECAGPTPGSSNISYSIDPENKTTYFKYDKIDRRWITIRKVADIVDNCDYLGTNPNADDWCEYTTYDKADNVLALTDANTITTSFSYFDNNWLEGEAVDPGGLNESTIYSYDAVGNVFTIATPNGNVTTNHYNERNELAEVTDLVQGAGSKVASYGYDGVGNRISAQDGNTNGSIYTYDAVNRLTEVVDALGEDTDYVYDDNGNLVQTIDREDHVMCYRYDAINRRTHTVQKMLDTDCAVIDSDDLWTLTQYDAVGNVKQLIAAKSGSVPIDCTSLTPAADCEITRYDYDEINRLLLETYPDADSRSFTYDNASNLSTRTDQRGDVTVYEYNDLYYLTKRNYSVDGDDEFSYDTGGRMQTALRDGWLVSFTYDNANRIKSSIQNGQPVTYDYDIPASKRTLYYPGGSAITESMDLRGRLERVDLGAGPTFPITPLAIYEYDLGNRVTSRSYDNGVQASYDYNSNNWIAVLDHKVGATRVAGFAYDYDKEGNKKYEERLHQSNRSEEYQYDDAYHLQEYKVGELVGSTVPVATTQTEYNLDRTGNWDSKTTDGVTEVRTHNTVNEITAIDGVSISHDGNGNLTEDENYEYNYDQENRLLFIVRKADAKLVGEYQYDALGRRAIKTESPDVTSKETYFYYDDARVIEEQDSAATTQATYVYGSYIDEILTMDRAGQVYYYHQNALWSVEVITDATAAIVEQYAYDAYGRVMVTDAAGAPVSENTWGTAHSAIGNPYLFTGRRLDEEAGLYYYRARYYDADKGRFLQRDPLVYVDGMNVYVYVKNGPTISVDPEGMQRCCEIPCVGDERLKRRLRGSCSEMSNRLLAWAAFQLCLVAQEKAAKKASEYCSTEGNRKVKNENCANCKYEANNVRWSPNIYDDFEISFERVFVSYPGPIYPDDEPEGRWEHQVTAREVCVIECFVSLSGWCDRKRTRKRGAIPPIQPTFRMSTGIPLPPPD